MPEASRLPNTPLANALFQPDDGNVLHVYAVIDGAACEELLPKLAEHAPEYCCLYAGELEPDVEEVAPYLVKLVQESPFTQWLLESIGEKPWGIFCRVDANLREMRRHFRQFLMVKGPEGENLYFRYYDPRVLGCFLPTCNPEEIQTIFGKIHSFLLVGKEKEAISYAPFSGNVLKKVFC